VNLSRESNFTGKFFSEASWTVVPTAESGDQRGTGALSTAEKDRDKDHLRKVNMHSLWVLMGYFQGC